MANVITQERLKELLSYDEETGVFTRNFAHKGLEKGSVNGYLNPIGYVMISVNNIPMRAHRLAWLYVHGVMPVDCIDHVNHIRSDNMISNLRQASSKDNNRNRSNLRSNSVFGIRWRADRGSYRVSIGSNGIDINLGSFEDKFEAICARKSAENKYGYHTNHGQIKEF